MIWERASNTDCGDKREPAAATAGMEQALQLDNDNNNDVGEAGQRKKLEPHHIADLARSGISEEAAIRNALWSAAAEEVEEILGRSDVGAGLAITFRGIDGEPMRDKQGRPYVRIKPDDPKHGKYLSRRQSGQQIFLPSGVIDLARKMETLNLTEGEKKAISATERGVPCIGLVGNWGWIDSTTKRVLDLLLKVIQLFGLKTVTLIWDSDAATNIAFAISSQKLATALDEIGVKLRVLVLPGDGLLKVGLDDYLLKHDIGKLRDLLQQADAVDPKAEPKALLVKWARHFARTLQGIDDSCEKHKFLKSGLRKILTAPHDVYETVLAILMQSTNMDIHGIASEIRQQSGEVQNAELPLVLVPHVLDEHVVTANKFAASFFSNIPDETFFIYGGRLARITSSGTLEIMTPAKLQGVASLYVRLGQLARVKKSVEVKFCATLSKANAELAMETPEMHEHTLPLAAIVKSPLLVGAPGQIHPCHTGYNPECGGVYVSGNCEIPEVQLEQARAALRDLLSGFRFATPSDEARAYAFVITPALRLSELIAGHVPIAVIEADEKQTGKTLMAVTVAAIYGEAPATVSQRDGGVGGLDESFSHALVRGAPFVNFDNVRDKVDSKTVEAFLTSETFPARIPYSPEVTVNTRKYILTLTSNGVRLTPDLAARACFIRILNRGLGFQFPTWEDGLTILPFVRKYQLHFLGCVFSLIREWDRQGRPRVDVRQHSFRDWGGIVGWIVQELLGLAPLLDHHEEIQNRTASPDRVWLRQIAIIMAKQMPRVQTSASQLAEVSRDNELDVPAISDPTDTAGAAKRIGQIMATAFRDTGSVTVDNVVITRHLDRDDQGRELKKYAFAPCHEVPTDPGSPGSPEAFGESFQVASVVTHRDSTVNAKNGTEIPGSPGSPEAFGETFQVASVVTHRDSIVNVENGTVIPGSPEARKHFKDNNGRSFEKGRTSRQVTSDVRAYMKSFQKACGLPVALDGTPPSPQSTRRCVKSFQKACGLPVALNVTPPAPQIWSSQRLGSRTIAIDSETTVIQGHEIPTLVLASASDGTSSFVISRENLPAFLRLHRRCRWIFHNASFDFWVLQEALADHPRLQKLLWRKARDGELGDTMLLDQLLRIARDGTAHVRDLGTVAAEVARVKLDKSDPYRLRYGEILGKPLDGVDPGFLSYAAADAFATARVHSALEDSGWDLWGDNSLHFYPECIDSFGDFTEAIQIRAAIALSDIERRGIRVDPEQLATIRESLSEKIAACVARIEAAGAGVIFKRGGDGAVLYTKTGTPSISEKPLQEQLRAALAGCPNRPIPPQNSKGVSTSVSAWQPYRVDAFVDAWLSMRELGKSLSFCGIGDTAVEGRVHPRYTVCVGTGRTSCSSPNVQQLPRTGGFREAFVPADGHEFMTIDFSFVELVTLAAICEMRFGESALADTIRAGIDPHANTAALILGMELADFLALKETDPSRFKELRQRAKALNFGVPGGLGHERLCDYARDTYGVDITPEEAEQWRTRLIREVYPEIGLYLDAGQGLGRFCRVLGCTESELHVAMGTSMEDTWLPICIEKVVSGNATKRDGTPYNAGFVERIWDGLVAATDDPAFAARFRARDTSVAPLFAHVATTPTGRARGSLRYTEACNAPFQGLAADGAKEALFRLVKAGFRVVAFVHDEFLVEIPSGCENAVAEVERLVKQGMQSVIGDTIPVSTESSVSDRWVK